MNDFQERLQELLQENCLNRLQFSKILGVSSTTINGYFNNNYYPQIEIAIKISDYFSCALDYLFGLSNEYSNSNKNSDKFFVNFEKLLKNNDLPISTAMRNLHMGEYNYYRWKAGQIPKTSNLIEIAKYFDVSIDFLVGRTN